MRLFSLDIEHVKCSESLLCLCEEEYFCSCWFDCNHMGSLCYSLTHFVYWEDMFEYQRKFAAGSWLIFISNWICSSWAKWKLNFKFNHLSSSWYKLESQCVFTTQKQILKFGSVLWSIIMQNGWMFHLKLHINILKLSNGAENVTIDVYSILFGTMQPK